MKIALIGGAGTRVPLILIGLLRSHAELRTGELVLWDVDRQRQDLILRICRAILQHHGSDIKVRCGHNIEDTLEGAHFIIASVRVGGTRSRVIDEQVALQNGILGQETVGPGGWAMSLRTIPVILNYAQLGEKLAPRAWFLNFTNPVGVVLQALLQAGITRTIGICDTPRELFESVASTLRVPSEKAYFDYFGLNHLGWIRSVQVEGRDRLAPFFQDAEELAKVYHVPLFKPDYLRGLKLLPTEYVYFYVHAGAAADQVRKASRTRGEMVAQQEQELFRGVTGAGDDTESIISAYDNFLATRNATYFQVETGEPVSESKLAMARKELYEKAAGYERIAVDVMRAITSNRAAVFPVDVANNGALDGLDPADAVEVPSVIDANGAKPLAVGCIPAQVRPLLLQVKEYERLTAGAALEGSASLASDALAANPLVMDKKLARKMSDSYRQEHGESLRYLK